MRSASGIPELRARITHLEAEIERLTLDRVHTCHERCQRIACVQRREIERLRKIVRDMLDGRAGARDAARAALKETPNVG